MVSVSKITKRDGRIVSFDETKIAYGVDAKIISEYGAISPEVAQAMAEAAKMFLGADVGIGITGVAGAEEIETKSAGMVYIGIDDGKSRRVIKANYPGSRTQVKRRATTAALFELRKTLTIIN